MIFRVKGQCANPRLSMTLPHMPILGSSISAANKDRMSKILTNGDSFVRLSRKHLEKGGIARDQQFLLFPQCFQKLSVVDVSKRVSME